MIPGMISPLLLLKLRRGEGKDVGPVPEVSGLPRDTRGRRVTMADKCLTLFGHRFGSKRATEMYDHSNWSADNQVKRYDMIPGMISGRLLPKTGVQFFLKGRGSSSVTPIKICRHFAPAAGQGEESGGATANHQGGGAWPLCPPSASAPGLLIKVVFN